MAATPAQQVVSGVVLNSSGQPAVNAVVRHDNLAEDPVETGERGQFTISLKELDSWTILWAFSADGTELGKTLTKLEEGNPTIPTFTIRMTPEVRTITGTVLDSDGKPVENALVGGDGDGWGFPGLCTTETDGTFRFLWEKKVPLLRVYAVKGNVGFNVIGTAEQDEPQITPPEQISDGPFTITLQRPQTARVRVTDTDGKPLAGCTVFASQFRKETPESEENEEDPRLKNEQRFYTHYCPSVFRTKTDENGDATFDWIPAEGFTRIDYDATGPKTGITNAEGNTVHYGYNGVQYSFKNPKDLTIPLQKLARLEGKVVYSDGSPASWVRVSVRYENGHGIRYADADGFFELGSKPGSIVNIGIESNREAMPGVFRFNLGDGSEVMRPTFKLKKGTKLHGIVFHPDMTPCRDNFWICLNEKSPDPSRSEDRVTRQTSFEESVQVGGMYEFTLPPGQFEIFGTCGPMRSENRYFEISPDQEEIWIDLQLK
ncbi:MAG: carboxypeptidase-like regulatory domain-containing protein [Planctomycetaceae bacterium]|nr:carboxypeptidase-like regulatory domain-containing protein [Planctomycetaceae bacterium]